MKKIKTRSVADGSGQRGGLGAAARGRDDSGGRRLGRRSRRGAKRVPMILFFLTSVVFSKTYKL